MVNAARSRMKEVGSNPNAAAAQVLFELVSEEDYYSRDTDADDENRFEEMVASANATNEDTSVFEELAAQVATKRT